MLTEKELISKLQTLKDIKPRQDWVFSLKSEILNPKSETNPKFLNFEFLISNFFSQKSLAYSFATLLLVMIGMFGFAQYTKPGDLLFAVKKVTEQSQAALSGQTVLRQDVANLTNRINDLAQVTKEGRTANIPSAINEVRQSVTKVTESLKANLIKDPQSAKDLAVEVQKIKQLQTLADLTGTPEIKSLNNALAILAQNEITDLEKITLTEDQQEILKNVKDLYEKGDYATALEKILTINN
ncbi:MAG: hypothetical protein AAB509_00950 [Patescibacteria group bacterium]